MNKERKWRLTLYISIAIYVIIIILILGFLKYIPIYHNQQQRANEVAVKETINTILTENVDVKQRLEELYNDKRIELVVIDTNNQVVFKSVQFEATNNLETTINEKVVSNKIFYKVETPQKEYLVWLTVYFADLQALYDTLIVILTIVIILLFTSLGIVILVLYRHMVNPLKVLNQNIKKLKNFELDQVMTPNTKNEYNELSRELISFAHNLDQNISTIEKDYTQVESTLSKNEEVAKHKLEIIRALIHDLKTPIATVLLEIESLQRKKVIKNELSDSVQLLEHFPDSVNQIMQVLGTDYDNEIMEVSHVDLVSCINQNIKSYHPLMRQQNIMYEYIGPEKLEIETSKFVINQIISNGLSNGIKYMAENKELTIELFEDEQMITLQIINDSQPMTKEQVKGVFKLFSRIDYQKEGSGSGLFIAKQFANYINANISFDYKEGKAYLVLKTLK